MEEAKTAATRQRRMAKLVTTLQLGGSRRKADR
ncbi:MAG: hypothetical protein ACK2U5_14325 [Candidatus Promineifilaceae bacterium]